MLCKKESLTAFFALVVGSYLTLFKPIYFTLKFSLSDEKMQKCGIWT